MPKNLPAVPCAYPPVGSCGNKTSDQTGFCFQHRQMMDRAKNGFAEISNSALRSTPKMLTDDNEVPGTPDDALPRFVRHRGDPDSLISELQRHLSDSEMDQVEMEPSGARIPKDYHLRVAEQGSAETPESEPASTEAAEPEPEDGAVKSAKANARSESEPVKKSSRRPSTEKVRELARKRFPKQQKEIDSMLNQWDDAMESDPELKERWDNLSEDSQMKILEARLPSQKEVSEMTAEKAKQSNSRYLRESTRRSRPVAATLARIDASSRAAWMAPYDVSDGIVNFSGRFLKRLFRY